VPEDAYDAAFDRIAAVFLREPAGAGDKEMEMEKVEALLAQAWSLRYESPAEMLRIARLALLGANGLSPEELLSSDNRGAASLADLQSRAWAIYGNACRVAGDLDEAQGALDRAAGLLAEGTGDILIQAQLYELQASLEADRGNYDDAQTALEAAFAIYKEKDDQHMVGRTLISMGFHASNAGRIRDAVRLTQQGLGKVDEARDPGLVLSALHNQLWFFLESGRPREARTLLRLHRDRLATGEAQRLDLLWLDGRIKGALRDAEGALEDLEAAEQGFAATGRNAKAASVKLDQAAVHLLLGNAARALALVCAAEEALIRADVAKHILMPLAFLRQTLAEREVSSQYVLRLANVVRRNQRDA
jgi:tetratricopeptide (TPR) repeat protein